MVTTLNSLLAQHNIREMDLLAIDTEGEDLKVLRGIDLSQHRPALIVVEQGSDRTAILQLARGHGYRLWMDNGQDLFLVRGSKLRVLGLKIIGWIAAVFTWDSRLLEYNIRRWLGYLLGYLSPARYRQIDRG